MTLQNNSFQAFVQSENRFLPQTLHYMRRFYGLGYVDVRGLLGDLRYYCLTENSFDVIEAVKNLRIQVNGIKPLVNLIDTPRIVIEAIAWAEHCFNNIATLEYKREPEPEVSIH